jgi:hypothetical protein
LVDIEAGLDEGQLSQVPFGRKRFLRTLGLALFGVATGMVASQKAAVAAPTPAPCYGFPRCPQCKKRGSEIQCTHPNCGPTSGYCPTGTPCWRTCYNGTLYNCCDWTYNNKPCICSSPIRGC